MIIAEVKFANEGDAGLLLQDALNQIHEKGYYERYAGNDQKVTLLVIGFTGKSIACKMVKQSNAACL